MSNTKAVPKVVKRYFIVVLVGLVQKVAQCVNVDGEFRTEIVVQVHLLQQQKQFFVLPLPAVERGHPQPLSNTVRHLSITEIRKQNTTTKQVFITIKKTHNVLMQ